MEFHESVQNTWEQRDGFNNSQWNAQTQNFNYHSVPGNTETVAKPISTVPFLKDPNFVERSEYRELEEKLSLGRRRVALTGLGGVGKSQLAIECCHRMKERSPESWVFWIHASSTARLDAGLRELADTLKLPGRDNPQASIFRLVEGWLRGSGSQWLLILDNADLEDTLFKPMVDANDATGNVARKRPIDFLAIPSCGQTVLTTRNKNVALEFVDDSEIITVGPMQKPDAATLFQSKSIQHDMLPADIEELVDELGCIALAIVHAAAYIKSKVPPCPIQAYLTMLRKSIKSDASLLTANFGELRRDSEASNSAIVTWQISFEHIRQVRPSEADRLSLMSFFDHRSIPRTFIEIKAYLEPESTSAAPKTPITSLKIEGFARDASVNAELDHDVRILHDFHLIGVEFGSNNFEMHPLVQLSVRKWLGAHDIEDEWLSMSILTLFLGLPGPVAMNPDRWRAWYPHVQLILESQPQNDKAKLWHTYLLSGASSFMAWQLKPQEAEMLARRCWVGRKSVLADEDPETLESRLKLTQCLCMLKRFEDAFAIHKELLKIAERQFELDPLRKGFLVECLRFMGEYEGETNLLAEAETHLRRALDYTDDISMGELHTDCVKELTTVLLRQRKHSEAEDLCRQNLANYTTQYGVNHRDTIQNIISLADVLSAENKLDEASDMFTVALEGCKRMFGVKHILSLEATNKLANVLEMQGKMQEETNLRRQLVVICNELFGKEAHFTLECTVMHAWSLRTLNEHGQALDVMRPCAAISRRTLGPDHEDSIRWTQRVQQWEREDELRDTERRLQAAQITHDAQETRKAPRKRTSKRNREECAVQ